MAQNKRFLGLGFTFSATDKGLEKKLKNIKNLFQDINFTTNGMAKNIPKIKVDGEKFKQDKTRLSSTENIKTEKKEEDKTFYKQSATKDSAIYLQEIMKSYTEALGEIGASYKHDAEKIISKGIKQGKSIGAISYELRANAERMAESATVMGREFRFIKATVGYIKGWSGQVISKFEGFLDTLGVHLRDLIPKEFTAALGLFKAMISPIKDAAMFVVGSFKKSMDEKLQDKLSKHIDNISEVIGDNKSKMNLQEALNAILAASLSKEKGDSGLGNIGMLGGLAALLLGLIPPLGQLFKFITLWSSRSKIGKIAGFVGNMFGKLFNPLTKRLAPVINWFSKLGAAIRESQFIARIISFGNTIFTYGTKIGSVFAKIAEVFMPVVKMLSKIQGVAKFLSILKLFSVGFLKAMPIVGWLLLLIDVVRGVWKAFEESTGVFDFFRKAILNIIDNILVGLPKMLLGDTIWSKVYGDTKESTKMNSIHPPSAKDNKLIYSQENNLNNKEVSSLLKSQNELTKKLIDEMKKNKDVSDTRNEIYIKTNSREIQAQSAKRIFNHAVVTGNGI